MELIIVSLSGSVAALLLSLSELVARDRSRATPPPPTPDQPQYRLARRLRAWACQSEVTSGF